MTVTERAQAAMARLLLSATSVDRDVREEADDAVKNLIAENEYLRVWHGPVKADLAIRRAVAALEDYLIVHALDGSFADKAACVERIAEIMATCGNAEEAVCADPDAGGSNG